MDNADSSPALTFPNVPDDFCPTGNWQNVFQAFIDEVLSNGTILVPGLGDVTPQQITQINQTLADQQNEIDALETRVTTIETNTIRVGTITGVTTGDSVRTVTFATLPTANYAVSITPVCSATIGVQPTPLFSLNVGSKTTTGFSIRIENNIAEITSVEWMAIHALQ
jgi:hypothetical protein